MTFEEFESFLRIGLTIYLSGWLVWGLSYIVGRVVKQAKEWLT